MLYVRSLCLHSLISIKKIEIKNKMQILQNEFGSECLSFKVQHLNEFEWIRHNDFMMINWYKAEAEIQ